MENIGKNALALLLSIPTHIVILFVIFWIFKGIGFASKQFVRSVVTYFLIVFVFAFLGLTAPSPLEVIRFIISVIYTIWIYLKPIVLEIKSLIFG